MCTDDGMPLQLDGTKRNKNVWEAQIIILHMATLLCQQQVSFDKTIFCLIEYCTTASVVLIRMLWV